MFLCKIPLLYTVGPKYSFVQGVNDGTAQTLIFKPLKILTIIQ